ncbi:helix-turn-helix domain-containing protein [Helicobacter sp. T3_23-1056]
MEQNFSNATDEEIASFYARVSANVRYYREKSGISQLDLALEIGIKSVAFYSNCENNRYGKHFNLEHIYKLSKALQIPLSALFEPLKA